MNKTHRSSLSRDLRVPEGLAGVPVDHDELPSGRMGVLGGEAARQHGAGAHVEDQLGPLPAVLVCEQGREAGVGGAGHADAGVEPDRAVVM